VIPTTDGRSRKALFQKRLIVRAARIRATQRNQMASKFG
jgi:hypothetical protein